MDFYETDSGGVFGAIISDMKQMSPLLEDLLLKASKFYSALRTSASTADAFLESFQKLADATTNSKGSTKDLGVSFTKLVMRHKSIENKLKIFLGVFTDNFIWPLQEKLEEYKKATSQLEKDHSKDVKKVKSDTKKAASEVIKLKKKLSKKGRQEHHEQYTQAVKHADILCSALEDQEKHYLRRAMIEERTRTCHVFNCYRPVIEHELSLIGEIETLQSILEETVKQTRNPNQLPAISDDAITHFKTPERSVLPKDGQRASPPCTPSVTRDRSNTTNSLSSRTPSSQSLSPTHASYPSGSMTLSRSKTMQSASGYGTLRKSGPPPKPVDLPIPSSMINQPHYSTDPSPSGEMFTSDDMPTPPSPPDDMLHETHSTEHSPTDDHPHAQKGSSINKLARTSWSSNETSDSSGIGSYNSLTASNRTMNNGHNNNNLHNSQQIVKDFLSGNTMEALETHLLGCEDIYSRMTYGQVSSPSVSPRHGGAEQDNQFKRNAFKSNSLRGPSSSMINSKAAMIRSNSIQNGDDKNAQLAHEMKLNFQRGKHNTVAGRPCNGGRTSVFNVFNESKGLHNQQQKSPTGTPIKHAKPPPPVRSVSCHGPRHETFDHRSERKISDPYGQIMRDFDEAIEDDSCQESNPSSFLAQIQEKRRTMRKQSTTEEYEEEGTML